MESGNHILNGIRCSLFVLGVFCGYSPLLVTYLVDVAYYTTMWKGDIGWSVIYDCVVERMGGTEWIDGRVVFQGCGSFRLCIFFFCMIPVRISQQLRRCRTFYWLVVGRVGRCIWLVGMYLSTQETRWCWPENIAREDMVVNIFH